MNVSAIQVVQAAQPQSALTQSSQKVPGGAAKTAAVHTAESAAAAVKAPQSAAAAEINALLENGKQNTESSAGATGTHVNLFA